jgi:hypothetical protein
MIYIESGIGFWQRLAKSGDCELKEKIVKSIKLEEKKATSHNFEDKYLTEQTTFQSTQM